jgi:CBS domain-containing protein
MTLDASPMPDPKLRAAAAIGLMSPVRVLRLFVVDRDGRLIGVVHTFDLLNHLLA